MHARGLIDRLNRSVTWNIRQDLLTLTVLIQLGLCTFAMNWDRHAANQTQKPQRHRCSVVKTYHTFTDENEDVSQEKTLIETKGTCLREREDVFLWIGGVAFIVILIGVIFGIGHVRHWDAQSGYTHNTSATSRDRFLPEPYTPEPGVKGRYGTGADSRWYYWKLPPDRVTPYTQLFVWLCYIGHQVLAWTALYIAQYHKATLPKPKRYSSRLTKWNYISFGLHVFFHLLHLLQTHTTYDGLAQDVSVSSSQGGVIMILVFILLIEYRDRGIVFLWPTVLNTDRVSKKLRLDQAAFAFIRRYHGYGFAWGAIYDFWYHPMENTWGHALGFFHTWLILLQGSLVYTNFHLNKYWRFFLETWVIVHGTVIALQTGGPDQLGTKLWPMFCFGFAFLIVFTQTQEGRSAKIADTNESQLNLIPIINAIFAVVFSVFSLPFWRQIHWSFRVVPLAVYLPVTIYMYSWIPDAQGRTFVRLQEIIRIPAAYYLGFIYAWFLLYILLKLEKKLRGEKSTPSVLKSAVCLISAFAIFVIFVGISTWIQVSDVQMGLIVLMFLTMFIFITGVCIAVVIMNQTLPAVMVSGGGAGPCDVIKKTNGIENVMATQNGEL